MAPVAIIVVNPAPGDLLRLESEFGVAFAALDIAAGQERRHHDRDTKTQSQLSGLSTKKNARSFHLSVKPKNKPLQ